MIDENQDPVRKPVESDDIRRQELKECIAVLVEAIYAKENQTVKMSRIADDMMASTSPLEMTNHGLLYIRELKQQIRYLWNLLNTEFHRPDLPGYGSGVRTVLMEYRARLATITDVVRHVGYLTGKSE